MAIMTPVIVRPGQTQAFAIRSFPTRLLTVDNRGGQLHFTEYDGAIGTVRMDGLHEKIVQCSTPPSPGMVQVHLCNDEARLMLCTPQSDGKTCVYADVYDSSFCLVGGAEIVGTISGNRLDEKYEIDLDEILQA